MPAQGAQALDVGQRDILHGSRAVALLDAQLLTEAGLRRVALCCVVLPKRLLLSACSGHSVTRHRTLGGWRSLFAITDNYITGCHTAAGPSCVAARFSACSFLGAGLNAAFLLRPLTSCVAEHPRYKAPFCARRMPSIVGAPHAGGQLVQRLGPRDPSFASFHAFESFLSCYHCSIPDGG